MLSIANSAPLCVSAISAFQIERARTTANASPGANGFTSLDGFAFNPQAQAAL